MHNEFVIVWFPRKRAYYRVPVNRATEQAVWRLDSNADGYYDLCVKSDEALLWKYAQSTVSSERVLADNRRTPSTR